MKFRSPKLNNLLMTRRRNPQSRWWKWHRYDHHVESCKSSESGFKIVKYKYEISRRCNLDHYYYIEKVY